MHRSHHRPLPLRVLEAILRPITDRRCVKAPRLKRRMLLRLLKSDPQMQRIRGRISDLCDPLVGGITPPEFDVAGKIAGPTPESIDIPQVQC